MANHEAFSLTPFPVDILFARYDVIQEWNLDASELVMPYWRLYRPENSFGYIRIKEQEIQLQAGKIYLIVGGSMGAGNICGLVRELDRQSDREDNILVICGSNQQIYDKLQKEYQREGKVQILGWTDKMPLFLHAADALFTKPGGLTSTEAATAGCPMVHIDPIPGCETAN